MARVSLSRVQSLPDIISNEAYEFILGSVPNSVGNDDRLILKCLNANIPGFSNEVYEVNLHSHVLKYRGRKMYPRTMAVTYVEDSQFHTLKALRSWHEFIVGTESSTSASDKAQYSINPVLITYNGKGEEIDRTTFYNLFINDVPDVPVSGESSTMMQISVTFSYDHFFASSHGNR